MTVGHSHPDNFGAGTDKDNQSSPFHDKLDLIALWQDDRKRTAGNAGGGCEPTHLDFDPKSTDCAAAPDSTDTKTAKPSFDKRLEQSVKGISDVDAKEANQILEKLSQDPENKELVTKLQAKLKDAAVPFFTKQLGDDNFHVREGASAALTAMMKTDAKQAVYGLVDAAAHSSDTEVRVRSEQILAQFADNGVIKNTKDGSPLAMISQGSDGRYHFTQIDYKDGNAVVTAGGDQPRSIPLKDGEKLTADVDKDSGDFKISKTAGKDNSDKKLIMVVDGATGKVPFFVDYRDDGKLSSVTSQGETWKLNQKTGFYSCAQHEKEGERRLVLKDDGSVFLGDPTKFDPSDTGKDEGHGTYERWTAVKDSQGHYGKQRIIDGELFSTRLFLNGRLDQIVDKDGNVFQLPQPRPTGPQPQALLPLGPLWMPLTVPLPPQPHKPPQPSSGTN